MTSIPGTNLPPSAAVLSPGSQSSSSSKSNLVFCISKEECPICLDEFSSGRAIFIAECGHKFHYLCILQNINHDEANADKCPICRQTQKEWPENTSGLKKSHPYCTNCGKRGVTSSPSCEHCGTPLAHTPTAQERARLAAAAASRNNIVVECPTCQIRCLVNIHARGTLQCPNSHLFQVQIPPSYYTAMYDQRLNHNPREGEAIIRQCPTCYTRIQMPRDGEAGQYMCPRGHSFFYQP